MATTISGPSTMQQRLLGKTILITGASSGIGRSTALEFARTVGGGRSRDASGSGSGIGKEVAAASSNGPRLRLVLTARRIEALRDLAREIEHEHGSAIAVLPLELDVADAAATAGFVSGLAAEWKEVDVLVNNAGLVKGVARAPDISPADITTMLATNVTGLIGMTQAVLPGMLARADGRGRGDIINVGSVAGREPYVGGSVYCATKAAVRSFTDSLRRELVATRVRVVEVDPGQVKTEFSLVRFDGDQEKADAVYEHFEPLTPEDVAEIIVFAAGRRENVVLAETLVLPNQQAGTGSAMYRKPEA